MNNSADDHNMEIECLETILRLGMSDHEAKVLKLCNIYLESCNQLFPDQRRSRLAKGDPRKSVLFKYCYKLLRETQHQLSLSDYQLYIHAQLSIIRSICLRSGSPPYYGPSCLVGEKAWKRWCVWNKKYIAEKKKVGTSEVIHKSLKSQHIQSELTKTKQFFAKKLDLVDRNQILLAINNHAMIRWIAIRQVSPYYAILSPLFSEWLTEKKLTLESICYFDLSLYRSDITDDVKTFFKYEFEYEFEE